MFTTTGGRMLWLGLFLLAGMGCYGANPSGAAVKNTNIRASNDVCPDDGGNFPPRCTKEIRIYNNTSAPIWPVIQASIQLTDAINCPKIDKDSGGDVWLQRALGNTNKCFAVKNDYYAFVNPGVGIPANSFVSVGLPWWSKTGSGPDLYIDWWRAGRVMLFDDKAAQVEIYNKTKAIPVVFAGGSPKPSCKTNIAGSLCNQLQIFRVPSGNGIAAHLPIQLNEYTFADIAPLPPPDNGRFVDYNQNYNVSNVDQVYLPVAIEPVRIPADVGYLGTTMSIQDFRTQLTAFANTGWPTYNNPIVKGAKMYPSAGIRVPSAQSVMGFYMDPGKFPDGTTPIIVPKAPPELVQDMLDQWTDCTAGNPQQCTALQAGYYKAVNTVFLDNYKTYLNTCPDSKVPDYLKKVTSNPPAPKLTAFLTFIYGWVPFNVACPNKELPVANDQPPGSRSVIDYTNQMQYNYQSLGKARQSQWFNPYTQLIHDPVNKGGLAASSYAFSIDDHVSFLSNDGGSLPGGLILAVGGSKGLKNGSQHVPPVPEVHKWYDFSIGLGDPGTGPFWKQYGICSDTAGTFFPPETKKGWVIGIDPAITKINDCAITFQDSKDRKYRLVIQKATPPGTTLPQKAIWRAWDPQTSPTRFDPQVVSCPTVDGFVPPASWCNHGNETSKPATVQTNPGFYTIGLPPPVN